MFKDFEGQNKDEIQYRVSMPGQVIPFGATFPVECWFAPLSKDWRLRTIRTVIAQKHMIKLDATAAESALLHISTLNSTRTYNIFLEEHEFAHDDENPDFVWNGLVRLPTEWDSYSQTLSSKIITITHSLVVTAEFQSPDGESSSQARKPAALRSGT